MLLHFLNSFATVHNEWIIVSAIVHLNDACSIPVALLAIANTISDSLFCVFDFCQLTSSTDTRKLEMINEEWFH